MQLWATEFNLFPHKICTVDSPTLSVAGVPESHSLWHLQYMCSYCLIKLWPRQGSAFCRSASPIAWCLHGTAPPYLAETLQRTSDMSAHRHLRSAATPTLVVPSTRRSTLGDRAFPVAVSRAWNSLPSSLRAVQSLTTFRRRLKAELFESSFT